MRASLLAAAFVAIVGLAAPAKAAVEWELIDASDSCILYAHNMNEGQLGFGPAVWAAGDGGQITWTISYFGKGIEGDMVGAWARVDGGEVHNVVGSADSEMVVLRFPGPLWEEVFTGGQRLEVYFGPGAQETYDLSGLAAVQSKLWDCAEAKF